MAKRVDDALSRLDYLEPPVLIRNKKDLKVYLARRIAENVTKARVASFVREQAKSYPSRRKVVGVDSRTQKKSYEANPSTT